MVKTTLMDPEEPEGSEDVVQRVLNEIRERLLLVSSLTAEDMARQLLDSSASKLTQDVRDYPKQMQLAALYTELAKAYILSDAIKYLADSLKGKEETHD